METSAPVWGFGRKLTFRFFFAFFILVSACWTYIPFLGGLLSPYQYMPSFFVQNYLLGWHDTPRWVHPPTGSGDTLDDFVLYATWTVISLIIALIWSALDRKRTNYEQLDHYFRIGLRFYLSYVMFLYGIIKLFLLQMPYPSLVQLHLPLGEFTPMRFAWMFVGYSAGYQFMSGLFETLGAVLLLFRRTYLLGALLLVGVLGHVVMLNYFYGVPVKLFSSFLLLIALYLAAGHAQRLFKFLVLNQRVDPLPVKSPPQQTWKRAALAGLPFLFLLYAVFTNATQSMARLSSMETKHRLDFYGAFDVVDASRNGMPWNTIGDTTLWTQIVVAESTRPNFGSGLVRRGTGDITLVNVTQDSSGVVRAVPYYQQTPIFEGSVEKVDDNSFVWNGVSNGDTLRLVTRRNERNFTLHTRSFRWVLEQNDF